MKRRKEFNKKHCIREVENKRKRRYYKRRPHKGEGRYERKLDRKAREGMEERKE